jgi:hypothetical protein
MTAGQSVRVAIGRIRISAASALEARRLGDALPTALERSLAGMLAGAPACAGPSDASPAEAAAARVAEIVGARMRDAR